MTGLSSAPYVSSFRPLKSARIQLEYDTHNFTRLTFTIDDEGNLSENKSVEIEAIEIAKDWQRDIGDKPKNGYISKGFMKFAFLV